MSPPRDRVAEALKLKRSGDPRRAIALFEEAIEEEGETPFLLSNLGHCLFLAGDLTQARSTLEEALRRDPKNAFAVSFLARVAEKERRARGGTIPRDDADGGELRAELKRHFGFEAFRPGQEEVVRSILSGRHTLAVMPTGRGKSLCFQLPAVMRGGLSVVVSPLIALMKDQVDELSRRGIPSAALNSSLAPDAQEEVVRKAAEGALRFLYVAPERFKVPSFVEVLPRLSPRFFVIDEAHCISQWGHDFRPDYLRLGKAVAAAGRPQVVAMTATATPDVQQDIVKQLGIPGMESFVTGFERPNLSFAVTPISGDSEREGRLSDLFRTVEGSSIVYCASRKASEEVGAILKTAGVAAGVYHAGMEHEERIAVQDAFMKGEIRAISATNAFGMGIDKADIRLVCHWQMPGSLEAYYQEAGRAGRDGRPSRCELLFSFADRHIQEFFIDGSNPSPEVIRGVWRVILDERADVVELSARAIAARVPGASDMTVGSALSLLERMELLDRRPAGEAEGALELLPAFLLKAPSERAAVRRRLWEWIKVESGGGDRGVFGVSPATIARELSLDPEQVHRALRQLADDGLISYRPPFRGRAVVVRRRIDPKDLPIDRAALAEKRRRDESKLSAMTAYATARGCRQARIIAYFGGRSKGCGVCDACRGERSVPSGRGPRRPKVPREGKRRVAPGVPRDPLFERLRVWRLDRALAEGLPAFCVLTDRALHAIVRERPADAAGLADCFGVGRAKAQRYGEGILTIVAGRATTGRGSGI